MDPKEGLARARAGWDSVYAADDAPWDIGRPQSAFVALADAGEIRAPVLDSGCGTGEHALMLAARGMEAIGVDLSPTAIDRARQKAQERGLSARFENGNALALGQLGRRFATILDCGVFHIFDDENRARYASSLASVIEPSGVLHLLCFSEHAPGTDGPRRVTQAELRDSFADGWRVDRIEPSVIEVREDFSLEPPRAWLARIVRSDDDRDR